MPTGTARKSAPSSLFIGDSDHIGFAAAEVVIRDGGAVARRLRPAADVLEDRSADIAGALERLALPRRALAGLSLDRPRIMGIVNVTPDSFSDGGKFFDAGAAIAHALQLEAEGAEILDIGGESTRPGSETLDPDEECRRVIPVIAALARQTRTCISIDTRHAQTMQRAIDAGARLVNDISALGHDPDSLGVVARSGLPVVLMHMRGDPKTMQLDPTYDDVLLDVVDYLEGRIAACEAAGIARDKVIVDPGIGFGKTLDHNLALLHGLSIFHGLGCPILLGASRKSFIAKLMTNLTGQAPADRLPGSLAAALLGAAQGAQIIRVHDVAATRQALAVQQGRSTPLT